VRKSRVPPDHVSSVAGLCCPRARVAAPPAACEQQLPPLPRGSAPGWGTAPWSVVVVVVVVVAAAIVVATVRVWRFRGS
jgi:hypothetical protein